MHWAVLILVCSAATLAGAQATPEDARAAEDSFEAGIRAMERRDWVAAEILFRQAYEADPSERTRLHLAEALLGRGEWLAARVEATAVLDGPDLLLRDAARPLVARIDAGLATIRITVRGHMRRRAGVRLDGQAAEVGVPIRVEPGHHRVVLVDGDLVVARSTVSVAAGGDREVILEADLSPKAVVSASAETRADPAEAGVERERRRRLGLGIGAAVLLVVAVVIAITFAVRAGDADPNGGVDAIIFEAMARP